MFLGVFLYETFTVYSLKSPIYAPPLQKQMDAESRVSNLERLNKDLNRQIAEIQDNLDNESRDKHTLMAKMR